MLSVRSVDDFMSLYGAYYPRIYGFFYRDCFHRETAEDLTSATFTKALHSLKTKQREILNFNAWIYRIATNELLSHLNRQRRRKAHQVEDTDGQLVETLADKTQTPDGFAEFWPVRRAVQDLPPAERVLVEMHFFEKMDYREMSEALNVKEVTLRSKIHRTLKKLRGVLEELEGDGP
jgi:RNA polymerase sigma factor (sigma-70 family)